MQPLWWNLGWIVLGLAWLGPLPTMALDSFAAHMTLHMLVVALAAPLISCGMTGRRLDPVRAYPWLAAPVIASVVELLMIWLWHAPVLHVAARHSTTGFVLEQTCFLMVGLWLWLAAFGGHSQDHRITRPGSDETSGSGVSELDKHSMADLTETSMRARYGAGVLALLLTSMHMTLLGALLILSPRPLFKHHHHTSSHVAAALDDQQLGGAIMLVGGGVVYLVGGVALTAKVLQTNRILQTTRTLRKS